MRGFLQFLNLIAEEVSKLTTTVKKQNFRPHISQIWAISSSFFTDNLHKAETYSTLALLTKILKNDA